MCLVRRVEADVELFYYVWVYLYSHYPGQSYWQLYTQLVNWLLDGEE